MALNITQKGRFFFVEDDGSNKVIGTFTEKEQARAFAKEKTAEMNDYFKKTKVRVSITSDNENI